jgi:predicted dinucleotide-binding enzyme
MRIAVLGAGPVGRALAARLARRHPVALVSRGPVRDAGPDVAPVSYGDAAEWASVIVPAVPFAAVREALARLGPLRAGTLVLDPTNPWGHAVAGESAAELIAGWVHPAPVVKAFNTVPVQVLAAPGTAACLYCGDVEAAKDTAAGLIADAGFDPVDVGALPMARLLEPLAAAVHEAGARRGRPLALALREP